MHFSSSMFLILFFIFTYFTVFINLSEKLPKYRLEVILILKLSRLIPFDIYTV